MDPRIVLGTIIGANVGVYFYWQFAIGSTRQFGDYSRLQFMRRHFTNSIDNFKNGRIYTLLTYAFSHQSLNHLGVNMLVLWSMGTGVISAIGASRFLLLYSGASVVGGLVSLAYQQYLRPALEGHRSGYGAVRKVDSVGASAGVMGITTFFACACKLSVSCL
ncbi:uncharacterized protein BYT42DRAFT_490172 [Radiomyces spectabilis]|uniref:uncharacterized protein n=1 Tax=Radiomyces spectabilis TaxID=64574 RepID=UPI002220B2EF|nr:uncharacterized protein BYT42DRAFT_490172 [Radiomyces spectabilis]KAI8391667.1 hypothetical protein BYT42DRAFT_490172 [Radiomyces spectabilis]